MKRLLRADKFLRAGSFFYEKCRKLPAFLIQKYKKKHEVKRRIVMFAPVLAAVVVLSAVFAFTASQDSKAQASTLPTWECTADGILFQYPGGVPPTQMYAVGMVTGEETLTGTIPDERVNGIGYNVADGYLYGWKYASTDNPVGMVRVGNDGSWEYVNIPGFTGASGLTGDVDENGHFWMSGNAVNGAPWAQIDLANGTVIASGTMDDLAGFGAGADWAYVPGGGDFLYRIANNVDGNAYLLGFNRTTKQHQNFGSLGVLGANAFGGVYADADGFLYGIDNTTGQIFRVDIQAVEATKFADGPDSSNTDGAMCAAAHIYTDYGDAPNQYGTLLENDGPRHHLRGYDPDANTADLMLGTQVSHETDGQPSADASADTFDDSVADPIHIFAGETTDVDVVVTNNTDEVATLVGWIDLNGNGTLEAGERVTLTVPANSGTDTHTLSFPASALADNTFARFRVLPGDVANPLPTGPAAAGEVEDYEVSAARVTFTKTVSPDDTIALTPGETFTYTIQVANTGSVDLTGLSFTDNLADVVDDATYNNDENATIGTVNFVGPDQVEWNGDLTVGQTATITYTVTVNDPISGDGVLINGVVGDGPGSNCTEDPAVDPDCLTRVPQPDISTQKTLVGPANPQAGDVVDYQITVTNNGAAAASGVSISDDLSGALDDAVYNGDGAATTGTVSFNASNERLNWGGSLAANGDAGDTVTITYSLTINGADDMGDGVLQNAIIAADCPNPPIFDTSDPNFDPDCVTITPIEAWMATKTAAPSGNVVAGGTILYTVSIENTGGADLTGLSLSDDLTQALDDAVYNEDASVAIGAPSYTEPTLTWDGDLASGEATNLTYSLTVNDAENLGDGVLSNAITGPMNCPGDVCETTNLIEGWVAQKSVVANDPAVAGDVVTYTVAIENTGGADLTDLSLTDDLSSVLDDATYNNDGSATIGAVDFAAPNLTWSGNLSVGANSEVTYSVTVNDASEEGDGVMTNALLGAPNCPDPAITDPSDPDFNPDCVTVSLVSEWIATKSASPAGAVDPEEVVNYTITVRNTGGVDLTGADAPSITDDLSGVLGNAAYNNDESATIGSPTYSEPELAWSNDLLVGETSEVTYSVTTHEADNLTDGILVNAITGSPNCPDPAVTDPSDPAYNPDCVPITYIAAFEMRKMSDPESGSNVRPGDVITYRVEVENTGALAFSDFTFTDNLANVLDDASLTSGPTVSPSGTGTATVTGETIVFDGDIPVGQTVSVEYAATVNESYADGQLVNFVTGPFSNCVTGEEPECLTTHVVQDPPTFMEDLAETGRSLLVVLVAAIMAVGVGGALYVRFRGVPAFLKR